MEHFFGTLKVESGYDDLLKSGLLSYEETKDLLTILLNIIIMSVFSRILAENSKRGCCLNCPKIWGQFIKKPIDEMSIHVLAKATVNAFIEVILHNMGRKEAETFLSNIMKVFHFGFLHLLGFSSGE